MATEPSSTFADLRILSDWFARVALSGNRTAHQQRLRRLGATAVPLLGRELRQGDPARRDAAREALALLATTPARARVIDELRDVTAGASADEAKVSALGLLAELGERGEATFSDPSAMQRRSALALAAQLETPGDVAGAVDFMIRQLGDNDIVEMMQVLVEATPAAAHVLGAEVALRLDVAYELRERIADLVALAPPVERPAAAPARRNMRLAQVALLVDAAARIVIVATRKIPGERRWRRWAVLISASGRIEDCLHEDDADDDGAMLIANLTTDGYRVSPSRDAVDHARAVIASAARLTGDALGSAYYVGRDLLELGDAHIDGRRGAHHDAGTAIVARAIELLEDHEPARAQALLDALPVDRGDRGDRGELTDADAAAARAACLAARGQWQLAAAQLAIAIDAEPAWPLHHWNLAVVRHRLGDPAGTHDALVRFVAASAQPTALRGDPDQAARLMYAERLIGDVERTARLARPPKPRRRRPRR